MKQHYIVTKDSDGLAPAWLVRHLDYKKAKILYRNIDGHAEVKGVRIGNEVAEIGDAIIFDGKRLSIERR